MTIEKSAFAEAKSLLVHFKNGKRIDDAIADSNDALLARFSIDLPHNPSSAASYLLYAALQSEFGGGSVQVNGDDVILSLPHDTLAQGAIPTHQLEQGLHRVRKTLLSALEQTDDNSFVINKQRMGTIRGISHIDLEDLTKYLVDTHGARSGTKIKDPIIEATYRLPQDAVYVDGDKMRHRGEVKQVVYANYISENQQAGKFFTPFSQAEERVRVDADVLRVIYRELGVEMNPGRAN